MFGRTATLTPASFRLLVWQTSSHNHTEYSVKQRVGPQYLTDTGDRET